MARIISNWQTRLGGRVGSDCESYAELYQQWLAARRFSDVQRGLLPQAIAAWPQQPRIVPLVLDVAGDAGRWSRPCKAWHGSCTRCMPAWS